MPRKYSRNLTDISTSKCARNREDRLHGLCSKPPQGESEQRWSARNCYGSKKFHTSVLHHPCAGPLPTDQTVGSVPSDVLGVEYAGPIYYRSSEKRFCICKACILLFACNSSHLPLKCYQIGQPRIVSGASSG